MLRSIKSGFKILQKFGLKLFIKKAWGRGVLNVTRPVKNAYLRVFSQSIISRIGRFSSDNPTEIFTFAQSNFLGSIAPGQIPKEFISLLELVKESRPKVVVEIGFGRGGTLFCFWQVASKTADIISISIPAELPNWKASLFQKLRKNGQRLHFIREDSHSENALQTLKNILNGRTIDFLFIDGDHTYQGVKSDFTAYKNMMTKGGIVAFHDIVPSALRDMGKIEVDLFWEEIKHQYQHQEFIAEKNQDGWGIGVVWV